MRVFKYEPPIVEIEVEEGANLQETVPFNHFEKGLSEEDSLWLSQSIFLTFSSKKLSDVEGLEKIDDGYQEDAEIYFSSRVEEDLTVAEQRAKSILFGPSHEEFRVNGLQKVDLIHADFMTTLTGNATRQEVDTWPPKVEASKFVMASTDAEITAAANLVLTDDPTANDDLETLVNDVGPEPDDLRAIATVILTKSRAYKRLIGLASRLRREAKEAVTAATDPAVPIERVGIQLDTIEEQMTVQAQTAIQQWAG